MESLVPHPRRTLAAGLILATLSCGSPSAPATAQHKNTTAVYLTAASNASQGDTVALGIAFTPGDTPGNPLYLEFSFDGSLPAVDTLTIPALTNSDPTQGPPSLSGYIIIPGALPDGQLKITAILPVEGDTSSATVTIKDAVAPTISGALIVPGLTPNAFVSSMPAYSTVIDMVAGATDSLDVSAADNHSVAWLGWSFGPPSNARDSVAVAGAGVQASMPFTVPASLAGTTPTFSIFARDSDGNMVADAFGQVNIAPYVHHPVRTAAVDTAMTDIAYDTKRNVLYLSEAGHANVLVLSLASMTFQTPIALPAAPAGLDLTPGGDTLVVGLANTGDLAFVTLNGTSTTTVVQLTALDSVPGDSTTITSAVQTVRVAADGRVIVGTLRTVNNVQNGAVVELNLATSQSRIVYPGSVVALARSGDATRVIIWGIISYAETASLYDGVGHQYVGYPSQLAGPTQASGIFMSATQTGTSFLVGNQLFDASLNPMGVVTADNQPFDYQSTSLGYGSAISPSDTIVWLGGAGGGCSVGGSPGPCALNTPGFYFRFRVPTMVRGQEGQLIEVADAPQAVTQLVALPGDQTLIGVGANTIMAFDLTSSTPGPASSRVAHGTPRRRTPSVRAAPSHDLRVRLGGRTRSLGIMPVSR
jgi:hypothetical protein